MMKIGVIVLNDENESLEMAKTMLPFLTTIGNYAFGTSFEIVSLTDSTIPENKRKALQEKDGYLFVTPTFSDEQFGKYSERFRSIREILENKSAMVVCFGNNEEKQHTVTEIKKQLLNYQVALPAKEIFLPKYTIFEWEIDTKLEETINERVEQFLLWTMSMRYARSLKERLVI